MKINWKYTIGEIIIVIIGITIAFGLNSWASASKERKTKQNYIESLIKDIDSEIVELRKDSSAFEKKLRDISAIHYALSNDSDRLDTLRERFFSLPNPINFEPNDITYRTMINSGSIHVLSDFELSKALEAHYTWHQELNISYERQTKISENYFGPMMIYKLDYEKLGQGDWSILKETETRNIINSLYGTYMICKGTASRGIRQCEKLKSQLKLKL